MSDVTTEQLVVPISEDNPCGEDFSFSAEFDRIHEARREDDPSLDYGEWATQLKQADWNAVVRECEALLMQKTKDLRVAAWLTEGLVKTSGFAGLRTGLEAHVGLLTRFSADIHPRIDDGDDERRTGTISWFFQRAAYLIRCVPLTDSVVGRFSLMNYESAVSLQLQLQRHPDSVPDIETKVTLEKFSRAVAATEHAHFPAQLDIVEQCIHLVKNLASQLENILGDGSPSITPLTDSLESIQERLRAICKSLGVKTTDDATDDTTDDMPQHDAPPSTVPPAGLVDIAPMVTGKSPPAMQSSHGIGSRTEAVEALRQVSAYFRRAEPHSPVAYLADKALQWSEMPLHLWLRNVVKDPGVLAHLEEMLGAEDRKPAPGD